MIHPIRRSFHDHLGLGPDLLRRLHDRRAGGRVLLVGESAAGARTGLHQHLGALARREPDPPDRPRVHEAVAVGRDPPHPRAALGQDEREEPLRRRVEQAPALRLARLDADGRVVLPVLQDELDRVLGQHREDQHAAHAGHR